MTADPELPLPDWDVPYELTMRLRYQPGTGRMVFASAVHRPGETPAGIPKVLELNVELAGVWALINGIRREVDDYQAVCHAAPGVTPF